MELLILTGLDSGQTVSFYPADKQLDDWATYKVSATEGTGSDIGRYTASVDPSVSLTWVAFLGSSKPIWADVIEGVYWDLIAVEIVDAVDLKLDNRGIPKFILIRTTDSIKTICEAATGGETFILEEGVHTLVDLVEFTADNVTLRGFGTGSKIEASVIGTPLVTLANNLTFADFQMTSIIGGSLTGQGIGYNTNTETPPGFLGVQGLRLVRLRLDCAKDALQLFPTELEIEVIAQDCYFGGNGGIDIAVDLHGTATSRVLIERCEIESNNDGAILAGGPMTLEIRESYIHGTYPYSVIADGGANVILGEGNRILPHIPEGIIKNENIVAAPAAIIEEFKADVDLGTGVGGLVTNANTSAAEVVKIQRSASEVAAGAAVTRNKVSATRIELVERIT